MMRGRVLFLSSDHSGLCVEYDDNGDDMFSVCGAERAAVHLFLHNTIPPVGV
jgi:hypothetical protein